MCGKATLAMEVSRTSINVASVTVTAITQGLIEPSGMRSLWMNFSIMVVYVFRAPLFGDYRGIHIHTRPQNRHLTGNGIEHNFYREALHYFHEIAGGIFGRQQTDHAAAGPGNGIHVAGECLSV